LTIIVRPVRLADCSEEKMQKYHLGLFGLAIVLAVPSTAVAKCSVKMPAADWGPKASKGSSIGQRKGDLNFECKTEKCGGPKNYVLLRQSAAVINNNGKRITGPLRLDGLEGNRFSDFYSVGEVYIGDKRFVSLIASGVKSAYRKRNLETLKAAISCR
jgi:hypothetical protein